MSIKLEAVSPDADRVTMRHHTGATVTLAQSGASIMATVTNADNSESWSDAVVAEPAIDSHAGDPLFKVDREKSAEDRIVVRIADYAGGGHFEITSGPNNDEGISIGGYDGDGEETMELWVDLGELACEVADDEQAAPAPGR